MADGHVHACPWTTGEAHDTTHPLYVVARSNLATQLVPTARCCWEPRVRTRWRRAPSMPAPGGDFATDDDAAERAQLARLAAFLSAHAWLAGCHTASYFSHRLWCVRAQPWRSAQRGRLRLPRNTACGVQGACGARLAAGAGGAASGRAARGARGRDGAGLAAQPDGVCARGGGAVAAAPARAAGMRTAAVRLRARAAARAGGGRACEEAPRGGCAGGRGGARGCGDARGRGAGRRRRARPPGAGAQAARSCAHLRR
jgi:hypothetical protein